MNNPVLKTSEDWSKEFDFEVSDPDGWARGNFQHSWFEERITKEEFIHRASASTIFNIAAFGKVRDEILAGEDA